jgi:hypothetical protein
MIAAPLLAVDLKACHKAGSGYRVVASVDEMVSVGRLTTIFIKLFSVVVRSSLRVLDCYDSGRLV